MTPHNFRGCLNQLLWSQITLAKALGTTQRQARRWADGNQAVPRDVAEWLSRLATVHEQNPPPVVQRPNRSSP